MSGNSWPARLTVYRGIQMRSRLEAAWAEQFDALGETWEYEPRCFASEEGQYLPDFLLTGPHVYVEVKPASFLDSGDFQDACERWFRILRASDRDTRLWIALSSGCDGVASVVEHTVPTPRRYRRTIAPVQSLHASYVWWATS